MHTWLTADLHFNHANIVAYSHRPFATVGEMNDHFIAMWQQLVQPEDEVYVLGDFAFWRATDLLSPRAIFDQLPGSKHLVKGNHDEKNQKVLQLPWASQRDICTIKVGDARLIACHYPIDSWKNAAKGYLHVHGHQHGNGRRPLAHRWDIGVDPQGYRLVDAASVVGWGAAQAFESVDHHGAD